MLESVLTYRDDTNIYIKMCELLFNKSKFSSKVLYNYLIQTNNITTNIIMHKYIEKQCIFLIIIDTKFLIESLVKIITEYYLNDYY